MSVHLSVPLRVIVMLLVFSLTAAADEVVLKDGKKITWTNLKDLGDSLEVETTDGVKVEIKKSDIVKIDLKSATATKKEEAAAGMLTGATFKWEKGRKLTQFDLLKSIDVKKDAVRGNWKLADGGLVFDGSNMKGGPSTMLETSYVPPDEYDLTVVAERATAGDSVFFIGVVGGGNQFNWAMDAPPGGWQGPWLVDGKSPDNSKEGFKEALFTKVGEKKTIVIMVRTGGFSVKVNEKVIYTYLGDWSRLKSAVMYSTETNKKSLFFGCAVNAKFKISQAVVTYPKE